MSASWRQLAAIPESVTKDSILRALAVDVPPEGVSRRWHDRGLYIEHCSNPQGVSWFVVYDTKTPREQMCLTPTDVLRAIQWPAGTPTGDAIRRWLTNFGYTPPGTKGSSPLPTH